MTPSPASAFRRPGCLHAMLCIALFVAGAPLAPRPALAQPAAGAPSSTPMSASETERVRLAAATRLARTALLYVREIPDPRPSDFRAAAMLLNEAHKLSPNDQEILRRLMEALHAAGDDSALLDATRKLIQLAPDDTVAQLRLISSRIRLIQDADARLAAYDRLLGPAGASIHASIRSRLALDAAMLARESGDERAFAERLATAAQLDPTNKDAATIAATFSLPRLTDPLARVELLANVILADPLDPSAHLNLARELMSHGAFDGARRFYERTLELRSAAEMPRDEELENIYDEIFRVRWALEGIPSLLDTYNRDDGEAQRYYEQARKALERAGRDPAEVGVHKPNPRTEKLRLIGATAVGRMDDARSAMDRVRVSAREFLLMLHKRAEEEPELGPRLVAVAEELQTETMWLALWSGLLLDDASKAAEVLLPKLSPVARDRYAGWLAMRRGDLVRAAELLTPIAEGDIRSRLGLGMLAELRGDAARAAAEYARVAVAQPGESIGLFAKTRIETLLDEKFRTSPLAASLDSYVGRLPQQIDMMTTSPRSFMQLTAEQVLPTAGALDRSDIRIRLRNNGTIPLAVGRNSPINSSMLLAPRLLVEGRQLINEVLPEVVSLDRRLMLRPGEVIEVDAWADQGSTGLILDQTAGRHVTLRWSVVQGFRLPPPPQPGAAPAPERYRTGPLCLHTETDLQTREILRAPNTGSDQDIIESLHNRRGERLLETILFLRYRLTVLRNEVDRSVQADIQKDLAEFGNRSRWAPGRLAEEERITLIADETRDRVVAANSPIAAMIASRYPTMSAEERIATAVICPPEALAPGFSALDEVVKRDPDPRIRAASLVLRVTGPDDPFLNESLSSEDPMVASMAAILRDRLATPPPGAPPAAAP